MYFRRGTLQMQGLAGRVIDWMMQLPEALEAVFRRELFGQKDLQQGQATSIPTQGVLLLQLSRKFGEATACQGAASG